MSGSKLPEKGPGSAFREALRLSLPATLSLLLHAGYRVNDQYWIQGLGPSAQAALGVTSFMLIFNFALVMLVHSGTLARIARATGSGDGEGVTRSYRTALSFGSAWFVTVSLLGYASTGFWVQALGAQGQTADFAGEYLRVIYLCFPAVAMKPVVDAMFIGMGNTLVPMALSAGSVLLNFALNPLLIYGWADVVPAMGIGGAALATGISRAAGALAGLWLLKRYFGLGWKGPGAPTRDEIGRVVRIGVPMAMSTAGYALVFIAILKTTVEPFGRTVQAGLGVAFNGVEAISYCALMGPAIAASSMVGRRLGAGDPRGARSSVHACMSLSLSIALFFTLVFLFLPETVSSVYSRDPQVIGAAGLYLWVVAWSQTATAAQSVFEQSLAGAGHTLWMSVFNVAGNALRIPLAWFMAHGLQLGPGGAWWALNLSNWLKLAAIFVIYRRGRWLHAEAHLPPARLEEPIACRLPDPD